MKWHRAVEHRCSRIFSKLKEYENVANYNTTFFTVLISASGIAQSRAGRLRLEDRRILCRFPARARHFSPLQEVQTSSVDEIHSYSLGNGGNFPWVKTTRLCI